MMIRFCCGSGCKRQHLRVSYALCFESCLHYLPSHTRTSTDSWRSGPLSGTDKLTCIGVHGPERSKVTSVFLFIALATRLHECFICFGSPAPCEQFVMPTVPSRVGGILCVLMSSEAHVVVVAIWLEDTG
jgi:hypothetical protein